MRPASDDRQLEVAGQALSEVAGQLGASRGLDVDDPCRSRRPRRVPVTENLEHGVDQRSRHRPVLGVGPEQRAQRLSMAEVGQPPHRTALLGGLGDLALEVDPEVGQRRGPHLAGCQRDARSAQPLAGVREGGLGDLAGQLERAAVVAATAVLGAGIVELLAQEAHPAAVGGGVRQHRGLLLAPGGRHPVVALLVVDPVLPGRRPAPAHAVDRPVDVEDLEHRLEAGATEVDLGLQGRRRHRSAVLGQRVQGRAHVVLGRERERGEVAPDVAVLAGRQQDHLGGTGAAPGAADLLVVGDR